MTTKRILVVDDEEMMLQMLTQALLFEDAQIHGVPNGEEALQYLENNEVDVVVTDIMMPGINGKELTKNIKYMDPFIQIIVITGYPNLKDMSDLLSLGICDYLTKPFNVEQLRKLVKDVCERTDRWKKMRNDWKTFLENS